MKIYTNKTIDNGIFKVSIRTDDFSVDDNAAMAEVGEPQTNAGGVFDEGNPGEFTLPNNLVRIKSDSPFTIAFDSRDLTAVTAQARANTWAAEMITRIEAAVDGLRAAVDTFTDESMITY